MALSKEELQNFKKQLLDLKKDLLDSGATTHEENIALTDETGELTSYDNHFADMASELDQREKDITLEDAARERLSAINTALDRIREGTYGICIDTGEEINKERLEAIPYAIRTKEAQDDLEAAKEDSRPDDEATFETPGNRVDDRIRTADDLQNEHGNSTSETYLEEDNPDNKEE
ncbi:TraR/DksA C4-type zinc finger protein [Alkalihalobacillus macyae]|uniref:TraR/DksA C4-type zinc finger protein n=1 Tax=Guptibacillus hwajinpoensis TaxID=208199 RepID=UPI00273C324F|nr:TraR/DksA C4-type zinc finger protein [Alkalihalobacillus macyae]MDP4552451.1 TraR/DksA C4-type zinc finger protein [Alkalihalobacillus macyae]